MTPRIAFTITYNALHHLQHRGFVPFMVQNFDLWVVVDGLSLNGGSTRWCNALNELPCHSTDGTVEMMRQVADSNSHVHFSECKQKYRSKDVQVNTAIEIIRKHYKSGWLWEVDADEHWTAEKLSQAEELLGKSPMREAEFRFNHYVGDNLIAAGGWGSGYLSRLFKWSGGRFISHEPARIDPHKRVMKMPDTIKFDHYSYYFEKDVAFKERYYGGYKGLLQKWYTLQTLKDFPQPLSALLPDTTSIDLSKSQIIKI